MNKNPLRRRRAGDKHHPFNQKPDWMCRTKYCYNERGVNWFCENHRVYMRVAKAKGELAKKYGISRKTISNDLAVLIALLQTGSDKSHG